METKMKIALLIIPATNGTIDRHRYLTDCIAMTMKEGYMPFLYDLIDNYTSLYYSDYIKKTLPLSDVVFLFEDFGKGENLIQLVENTDKTKCIYKKTLPGDVELHSNSLITILNYVSDKTKIPIEALQSKFKGREVADARYVYFRRAKKCTKESLFKIGGLVNRDHATVLHGIKEAENTKPVIELYEKCFGINA